MHEVAIRSIIQAVRDSYYVASVFRISLTFVVLLHLNCSY